jgi:hypothetical protein
VSTKETLTDFVDIEWPLRDEYNRCTTGKTRMCRNPTTVATHDFHHHHTVVRFSGGVQSVDCVSCNLNGRIESECEVGAFNVIVDGFRNSKHRDSMFSKQDFANGERPISANDDESINSHFGNG